MSLMLRLHSVDACAIYYSCSLSPCHRTQHHYSRPHLHVLHQHWVGDKHTALLQLPLLLPEPVPCRLQKAHMRCVNAQSRRQQAAQETNLHMCIIPQA